MNELFLQHFAADPTSQPTGAMAQPEPDWFSPDISAFLSAWGGRSFNQGLYRLHGLHQAAYWTQCTTDVFPAYASRITCFGYDWLGRQFALAREGSTDGKNLVLLFDIGFNEVLEIPADFEAFHNTELVNYPDDALAASFFHQWLAGGGTAPKLQECIGYRVPPVLGGKDSTENLELNDMEVYWGVVGQIHAKLGKTTR